MFQSAYKFKGFLDYLDYSGNHKYLIILLVCKRPHYCLGGTNFVGLYTLWLKKGVGKDDIMKENDIKMFPLVLIER